MTRKKHMGSDFDDYLKEEGILEEVESVAAKRVFVYQLEQEMRRQKLTKEKFAKRLRTSRSSLDRLLDPTKPTTLKSLSQAAVAVGKHLRLGLA